MSGIAERIRLILKEKGWSERELSRRAKKTESHVGLMLKALDKDPGAVELGTLEAIATGSGVSLSWLASGEGEMFPRTLDLDDPYPERAKAITAARLLGRNEQAIARVRMHPGFKSDLEMPADLWMKRIEHEEAKLADPYLAGPTGRPVRDDEVPEVPFAKMLKDAKEAATPAPELEPPGLKVKGKRRGK